MHLSNSRVSHGEVQPIRCGEPGLLSYRILYCRSDSESSLISPWHDISLFSSDESTVTCICTTPAGSWLIHESASEEPFNPLRPIKMSCSHLLDGTSDPENSDNSPSCCAAHYPDNITWNIGILPQTLGNHNGKNDVSRAVDAIDISVETARKPGDVYLIKPLGGFCVVVDELISWKIVGIAANDPMASILNDMADLNEVLPGLLACLQEWLTSSSPFPLEEGDCYPDIACRAATLSVAKQKLLSMHTYWMMSKSSGSSSGLSATAGHLRELPSENKNWAPYLEILKAPPKSSTNEPKVPMSCPSHASNVIFDKSWLKSVHLMATGPIGGMSRTSSVPVRRARIERRGSLIKARENLMWLVSLGKSESFMGRRGQHEDLIDGENEEEMGTGSWPSAGSFGLTILKGRKQEKGSQFPSKRPVRSASERWSEDSDFLTAVFRGSASSGSSEFSSQNSNGSSDISTHMHTEMEVGRRKTLSTIEDG